MPFFFMVPSVYIVQHLLRADTSKHLGKRLSMVHVEFSLNKQTPWIWYVLTSYISFQLLFRVKKYKPVFNRFQEVKKNKKKIKKSLLFRNTSPEVYCFVFSIILVFAWILLLILPQYSTIMIVIQVFIKITNHISSSENKLFFKKLFSEILLLNQRKI